MSGKVVVGIPTYNHSSRIESALSSLLGQTYRNLAVVVIDDCSSDDTPAIVESHVRDDPRVRLIRNTVRLGYVQNARKAQDEALRAHPEATYFAWGSDHDLWHPLWLEMLVAAMDRQPNASLAWPWFQRLEADGTPIKRQGGFLSKNANRSPFHRIRFAAYDASAGNALHGLFRVSALKRTPGLQPVLAPDRLLIAHLAVKGEFVEVPEYLWSRRYRGLTSFARQRRNFFPNRRPPLHSYLPISMQHGWALCRDLMKRSYRPQGFTVGRVLRATAHYLLERNIRPYYTSEDEIRHREKQIQALQDQLRDTRRAFERDLKARENAIAQLRKTHESETGLVAQRIDQLRARMRNHGWHFVIYAFWRSHAIRARQRRKSRSASL